MSHATTAAGHEVPTAPAVDASIRADSLQTALDAVGTLVEECRLEFRAEELFVRAADPAAVALVTLSLSESAFDSYAADGAVVGVDVERLTNVVGLASRDQQVRLLLDTETRSLYVVVDELVYRLGLVDPDAIRRPPELDEDAFTSSARAVVTGADVARFVGAASMVADHLELGVDADADDPALTVDADGDTDHVSLRFGEEDVETLDAGEARSLFSLGYLQDLSRPIPADATVDLSLGMDLPVGLEFDVADGAGSVAYLLSPRLVRT